MPTYQVINRPDGSIQCIERTNADGTFTYIPPVDDNSDYQAYLAYVANGNQTPTDPSDPTDTPASASVTGTAAGVVTPPTN